MFANKALASIATTTLFVLLWSSGAIVTKWGLTHATPFAFLLFRFLVALFALAILIPSLGYKLPATRQSMRYALATGVVLLGGYQICYLLALDMKVAPGVMATIMGVQPILTAVLLERSRSFSRMFGLSLGLAGLVLVVFQGIGDGGSLAGMAFGVLGMLSMTVGSIMQKRVTDNPLGTLPVQYFAGMVVCAVFVPFQPFHFEHVIGFYVPVIYMGLLVSVLGSWLLYRLIAQGNLVNVTSLFYLVPAVTAIMDYLIFGNRLALLSLLGMVLIVVGLVFVFRKAK
ncbi:DMT family transporter [Pseudomonas sp. NPDC088368]|jgi:drug/metabolite transporter (DMT)-like permease|uniref:DMT family transporter n=1 Tax=unclassified Pseudomonas TaxID=196821 RepID=UPI0014135C47|nr:DMT family transporter [Pseudomonas sp. SLFW]NBB12472.1 EamA family transporter [Pseudomonas sp. SLFW]